MLVRGSSPDVGVYESLAPCADPALHATHARVLGRPAAHCSVGRLQFGVDGFIGNSLELLMRFCQFRKLSEPPWRDPPSRGLAALVFGV